MTCSRTTKNASEFGASLLWLSQVTSPQLKVSADQDEETDNRGRYLVRSESKAVIGLFRSAGQIDGGLNDKSFLPVIAIWGR